MKVQIQYGINGVEIYIFKDRDGKRYVAKPVILEFEEIKLGERVYPTLCINPFEATEFLKSLAEALDKQEVKTENDYKIQGILEATKYHLEDMRRLVFKKEVRDE